MQIDLSQKEYQLLIDMLFLSDWMIHSYQFPEESKNSEHKLLFNKILAFYAKQNPEDSCVYSKELNEYFINAEQEDKLMQDYIEPYDSFVFWDELAERLATRDLIETIGVEAYQKMETMERVHHLEKFRELYIQQFEQHGLDNLKIHEYVTNIA